MMLDVRMTMQIFTRLFTTRIVASNRSTFVSRRSTASADAVVRLRRRRISLCDREKNEVSAPDTSAETHSRPSVTAHSTAIWAENPLNVIHEVVVSSKPAVY